MVLRGVEQSVVDYRIAPQEQKLTKALPWPKARWKITAYFTVISVMLGATVFAFPNILEDGFDEYRVLIAALIIVVPFVIFMVLPWIYKAIPVLIARVQNYGELQRLYERTNQEFLRLREAMAQYLLKQKGYNRLEIRKAGAPDGKLRIVLPINPGLKIAVGDEIEVIDFRDYNLMGKFTVADVRNEVVYAEETAHVDPIWKGFVMVRGETDYTPDLVALHIPAGGKND